MGFKKSQRIESQVYKIAYGFLTLTSMVCVVGMSVVSFHTWWSKLFIWSVVSSSIIDSYVKWDTKKVKR